MRIVAGTHRGRPLVAPKGADTRPTSDRVREAIFSSLVSQGASLRDARVLDLFCGSGALALEALSRGAACATLVDSSRDALEASRRNVASLGLTAAAAIISRDAFRLVRGPVAGSPFTLLFLDPPYRIDAARVRQLLEDAAVSGLLAEGATVVYELASGVTVVWPDGFTPVAARTYGGTQVAYGVWRREPNS